MASQIIQDAYSDPTIHPTLGKFKKIVKRYFYLNVLFLAVITSLVVLFAFCFSFFQQSFLIGILLAFFFFSFVMYFILRAYIKEQKPYQLLVLCNQYMAHVLEKVKEPKILATAAHDMAHRFDNVAPLLYACRPSLRFLERYFRPIYAYYFWQDVHLIKEFFLFSMIDELKNCIKHNPTDIQAHQDLALGYLSLFSHYNEPLEQSTSKLSYSEAVKEILQKKRAFAADSAVEECLILKEYTPDDPWVYEHLALVYHELGLYNKEIEAYEAIIALDATQYQALYTLGTLYFKQGMNAKGLKVYEQIRAHDEKMAQQLIGLYGAYLPFDPYRAL